MGSKRRVPSPPFHFVPERAERRHYVPEEGAEEEQIAGRKHVPPPPSHLLGVASQVHGTFGEPPPRSRRHAFQPPARPSSAPLVRREGWPAQRRHIAVEGHLWGGLVDEASFGNPSAGIEGMGPEGGAAGGGAAASQRSKLLLRRNLEGTAHMIGGTVRASQHREPDIQQLRRASVQDNLFGGVLAGECLEPDIQQLRRSEVEDNMFGGLVTGGDCKEPEFQQLRRSPDGRGSLFGGVLVDSTERTPRRASPCREPEGNLKGAVFCPARDSSCPAKARAGWS